MSVSATNDEIATAPAITSPNSWKSCPVSPPMKIIGAKMTTSATDVATTAKKISRVPSTPAWMGGLPSSIFE